MNLPPNEGECKPRYWVVPAYMAERLDSLPDEYLRLLLRLYYHAWQANDEWVKVSLAELAAGAGLSLARAARALASLEAQGAVERREDYFNLTPAAGEEPLDYPPLPEA